jgi:FeoC like transcriptional regulator
MALAELIRELEKADGPQTTAELAARLGTQPAVVAGMLDWLARSGRATSPCDPVACGVRSSCAGCALAPLQTGRRYLPVHIRK